MHFALIAYFVLYLCSANTLYAHTLDHRDLHASPSTSPLARYLQEAEENFSYTTPQLQTTNSVTLLTTWVDSLNWRSATEVHRTLWQNRVRIAIPAERVTDKAIIIVSGGTNNSFDFAEEVQLHQRNDMLQEVAREVKAVVVEVSTIPNQPLEFFNDGQPRREDDLIAFSWAQFLKTDDPRWLAQFPMVKSVVTAMNIAEKLVLQHSGRALDGWMVTGASKRGWVTWLVGALDPRVIGIAPLVIDVVNMVPSMQHHHAAYGFWADAVKDYVNHGIMASIDSPEMKKLCSLIDPYTFRRSLTMPKMIINAANDEFFLPDSSLFYVPDLIGTTYLRYVENSGHRLNNPDVLFNLIAFFRSLHDRSAPLPQLDWQLHDDHQLAVTFNTRPLRATLWQAENPRARDFRYKARGSYTRYTASPLEVTDATHLRTTIARPREGWKSFFIELVFATAVGEISLTTSAYVIGAL